MVKGEEKMKFKSIMEVILTLLLLSVLAIPFNAVPVRADPSTTVFVDPPTIEGKVIGETVTVNIEVSNVTDLYGWQAGLTFNPDVLNCTGYYEGEFLKRGAHPEYGTLWLYREYRPRWDNTKGVVYYHGCCLITPIPGVNGSGQLGYLTFEVIGTGVSDLHLTDVVLASSEAKAIQHEVVDVFTICWGGVDYSVETTSNLTGIWGEDSSCLFYHAFSPEEKAVTFSVITPHENFYEVTIPKTVLSCDDLSDWTVDVDGSPVSFVATESPVETFLYFTYHNSTHEVEITGTVLGTPGDVNGDLAVDIVDIVVVAIAFGSKPENPGWNPVADLNYDDLIDVVDIVLVAIHFGETYL